MKIYFWEKKVDPCQATFKLKNRIAMQTAQNIKHAFCYLVLYFFLNYFCP